MNSHDFSVRFRSDLTQALLNVEVSGEPFELDAKVRYYLIGNGGSATVAQHIVVDLVKYGYSACSLTDPGVMSMQANDCGWNNVFSEQIKVHAITDDVLIAISSSGQSENILAAARYARLVNMRVLTFSGFAPDNALRKEGHVNYHVPSYNYGVVEIAHLAIMHAIVNPGQ